MQAVIDGSYGAEQYLYMVSLGVSSAIFSAETETMNRRPRRGLSPRE